MKKEFIKIDIDKLKNWAKNPKKHKEDLIEKSINEVGYITPIIIDENNRILAGHGRLKALKKLGFKEVDVIRVEGLSEEQKEKFSLFDNRTTELGGWDFDLLKAFDVDLLKVVGFEDELNNIFDFDVQEDDFDVEKELEKIQEPKTRYGDLYKLGDHRLMCGDATKEEDVEKLMGGEKADMVFTDPPYNIGLDYSKKITSDKRYTKRKLFSDKKTDEDYSEFLDKAIKNFLSVVKNDSHIFMWCDEKYIWLIQTLYSKNGIKNQRVCLWIKNNFTPTPQCAFNKVFEPCVYGVLGKPKLNKKIKNLTEILNKNIQKAEEIYDLFFLSLNLWLDNRENVFIYQHTTQKPVSLCEKPIKRCSDYNDLILDVFGGSGSTLIACEQLKRRCYMMELDPYYCDVIISRWEKFTGKKAEKLN